MIKAKGLVLPYEVQHFIAVDERVGTEVAVGLPFGGEKNVETVGVAVADVDVVVARRAGSRGRAPASLTRKVRWSW